MAYLSKVKLFLNLKLLKWWNCPNNL